MRFLPVIVTLFIVAVALPAFADPPLASPAGAEKTAVIHNDEGIAALNVGKPVVAEAHFREAIKIAPSFARAHYNLALALHAQGKHGAATDEFRKAAELDPKDRQIAESGVLKTHTGGM